MELQIYILPILALISAGFIWTMGGYLKSWRNNHTKPEWKGFDKKSLRNDLVLGTVLGVASVIFTIFTDGNLTAITTAQEFFIAVGAGFTAVALVDKFIIGGIFKK